MPGYKTAMVQPLYDELVEYADGTEAGVKKFPIKDQKSGTCIMKSSMAAIRSLNNDRIWGRLIKSWLQISATVLMIDELKKTPKSEQPFDLIRTIQEHIIPKLSKHFLKDNNATDNHKALQKLVHEDFNFLLSHARNLPRRPPTRELQNETLKNSKELWLSHKQWPTLNPKPIELLRTYFSLETFEEKYQYTFNLVCKKNQEQKPHPIIAVLLSDLLLQMSEMFSKKDGFNHLWTCYLKMEKSLDPGLIHELEDENSLGLDYSLLGDHFRQMTAYTMIAFYHLSWFFYVKKTAFESEEMNETSAYARFDYYYRFFLMFNTSFSESDGRLPENHPLKYCVESKAVVDLSREIRCWQTLCKRKNVGLGNERKFLEPLKHEMVDSQENTLLNPKKTYNSWVLRNLSNKRLRPEFERFFPTGEQFLSKKLFSAARIWLGYIKGKRVGNHPQINSYTVPPQKELLTFENVDLIGGFLGTPVPQFKKTDVLNSVMLERKNNCIPFHTPKAVLHSLRAHAETISEFLDRFELLLSNDQNMLTKPHLFDLNSSGEDSEMLFDEISSYVSLVFWEGLNKIDWTKKDNKSARLFFLKVHEFLTRIMQSDRDVRMCRILWNISASLCEKMSSRSVLFTAEVQKVLNSDHTLQALRLDLDDQMVDVRARARWLMGLAKTTEDPSSLGSLFVWLSVQLSRLIPKEKIVLEVNFRELLHCMDRVQPGTHPLLSVSSPVFSNNKKSSSSDTVAKQYLLFVNKDRDWSVGIENPTDAPRRRMFVPPFLARWRKKKSTQSRDATQIIVWKNLHWQSDDFQFAQCVGVFKPEECVLFPKKENITILKRTITELIFRYGETCFELQSGQPLSMRLGSSVYYLDVFTGRKADEIIGLEQFAIAKDSKYSCWVPKKENSEVGVLRFHHSGVLFAWNTKINTIIRPYDKKRELIDLTSKTMPVETLTHWAEDTAVFFTSSVYLPTYGLHFHERLMSLKEGSSMWESAQFPEWVVEKSNVPAFFLGIEGSYALILKHKEKKGIWRILINYPNGISYEAIDCGRSGPLSVDQRWFVFMDYLMQNEWHTIEGNLLARKHVLACLKRYLSSKNGQLQAHTREILTAIDVRLQNDKNPFSRAIIDRIRSILHPENPHEVSSYNMNILPRYEHPVYLEVKNEYIKLGECEEKLDEFPDCWQYPTELDIKNDFVEDEEASFAEVIKKMIERSSHREEDWKSFDKIKTMDEIKKETAHEVGKLYVKFMQTDLYLKNAIENNQTQLYRTGQFVPRTKTQWPKILQLCLQNSEKNRERLGVTRPVFEKIREGAAYWLFLQTELQHLDRIKKCDTKLSMYHAMIQKRQYDPKEFQYYPLMLMEYVKDIRLRKKQVDLYDAMVKNADLEKGWLREAVTGSGKTTIIPAIVAKWRSGIILLPDALLEAQYNTLCQDGYDIYGMLFERFDRFYNIDSGLCNVNLMRVFQSKEVILIGTPAQFQELEMEIINRKGVHRPVWDMYQQMRSFGNVLCDECDELFRPDIAFVQAHGDEKRCQPARIRFFVQMLRWFSQQNLLTGIIPCVQGTIHGQRFLRESADKKWQKNIQEALKKCPSGVLDVRTKGMIFSLFEAGTSREEFLKSANHKVTWLYELIFSMLPFASTKVFGVNYGPIEGSDIVIPYLGGKPTDLQFSTVNEKVILTWLYFDQKKFTRNQFQRYIKHLLDEHKDLLNLQGAMKDAVMKPFLSENSELINLFNENDQRFALGYKCFKTTGSTDEAAQVISKEWLEPVYEDKELYTCVLDFMMSYFFERQIGYYPEMASVYPVDVTYLGKPCGFSATIVPENMDLGYFQLRKNEPNRAHVVANLSRLGVTFRDLDVFYNSWQDFDGQCIIDVNKSIDVPDMHRYIKKVILEEHTRFDYALYFVNDFPYLLKNIEEKWVQIKLKSTTKKELQAKGVSNFDKLFVFFDAAHCRGIDVPLSPQAKGWVLIGTHCSLDQILQGVGRLRSISMEHIDLNGQNMVLLISKELYTSLGYSTIDEVISDGVVGFFVRLEKRDAEKTKKNAVSIVRQFARNRFRKVAIDYSLSVRNTKIFQGVRSLFRSDAGEMFSMDSIYKLIDKWADELKGRCNIDESKINEIRKDAESLLQACTAHAGESTQALYQRARLNEDEKHKSTSQKLLPKELKAFKLDSVLGGNNKLWCTVNWKLRTDRDCTAVIPTVYAAYSSQEGRIVLIHPEEKKKLPKHYLCFQLARAFDDKIEGLHDGLIYEAWVWGGLFGLLYQKMQGENAFEMYKFTSTAKTAIDAFYPQMKWYQQRFMLSKDINAYFRLSRYTSNVKWWLNVWRHKALIISRRFPENVHKPSNEWIKIKQKSKEEVFIDLFPRFGTFNVVLKRQQRWAHHFGWKREMPWKDLSSLKQKKILQLPFKNPLADADRSIDVPIGDAIHKIMKQREENEKAWEYYCGWPPHQTYADYISVPNENQDRTELSETDYGKISAEVDHTNNKLIQACQKNEHYFQEKFGWGSGETLVAFCNRIGAQEHSGLSDNQQKMLSYQMVSDINKKTVSEHLEKAIQIRIASFKQYGWTKSEFLGVFADRMELDKKAFKKEEKNYYCWLLDPEDKRFASWKVAIKARQDFWASLNSGLYWKKDEKLKDYIKRIDLDLSIENGNSYSRDYTATTSNDFLNKVSKSINLRLKQWLESFRWERSKTLEEYQKRLKLLDITIPSDYEEKLPYEIPFNLSESHDLKPTIDAIRKQLEERKKQWKNKLYWEENDTLQKHLKMSLNINPNFCPETLWNYLPMELDPLNTLSSVCGEIEDRKKHWSETLEFRDNQSLSEFCTEMNIHFNIEAHLTDSSYSYCIPADNQQLLSYLDIFKKREQKCKEIGWLPGVCFEEQYRKSHVIELNEVLPQPKTEKERNTSKWTTMINFICDIKTKTTSKQMDIEDERFKKMHEKILLCFENRELSWKYEWNWNHDETLETFLKLSHPQLQIEKIGTSHLLEMIPKLCGEERGDELGVSVGKYLEAVFKNRQKFWLRYFLPENSTLHRSTLKFSELIRDFFNSDSDDETAYKHNYPKHIPITALAEYRKKIDQKAEKIKKNFPEIDEDSWRNKDSTIYNLAGFLDFYKLECPEDLKEKQQMPCIFVPDEILKGWINTLNQRVEHAERELHWDSIQSLSEYCEKMRLSDLSSAELNREEKPSQFSLKSELFKEIETILKKREQHWNKEIGWQAGKTWKFLTERLQIPQKATFFDEYTSKYFPTDTDSQKDRWEELAEEVKLIYRDRELFWVEKFWNREETFAECADKLGFKTNNSDSSQKHPREVPIDELQDFVQYIEEKIKTFSNLFSELKDAQASRHDIEMKSHNVQNPTDFFKIVQNLTDFFKNVQNLTKFYNLDGNGLDGVHHWFTVKDTLIQKWGEELKERREFWVKIGWQNQDILADFCERMNIPDNDFGLDKNARPANVPITNGQRLIECLEQRREHWKGNLGWGVNETLNAFLVNRELKEHAEFGKRISSQMPLTEKHFYEEVKNDFLERKKSWSENYHWQENETLEKYAHRLSFALPSELTDEQKQLTSKMCCYKDEKERNANQNHPRAAVYKVFKAAMKREKDWDGFIGWKKGKTLASFFMEDKEVKNLVLSAAMKTKAPIDVPFEQKDTIVGDYAKRIQSLWRKWQERKSIKSKKSNFGFAMSSLKSCRYFTIALLIFGVFFLSGVATSSYFAIHALSVPLEVVVGCVVLLAWTALMIRNAWVMNHSKKTMKGIEDFCKHYQAKPHTREVFKGLQKTINKPGNPSKIKARGVVGLRL